MRKVLININDVDPDDKKYKQKINQKEYNNKVTLQSGVSYNKETNSFIFDYELDDKDDIVKLNDKLKKSKLFDNTYYYGYEFKTDISSDIRAEFIAQLKGLSDTKIKNLDLARFLIYPVIQLGHKILHKFNTIIYPKSERSPINRMLVEYIQSYSRVSSEDVIALELIKQLPKDIYFDWNKLERVCGDLENYNAIKKRARKIICKINNLDEYFSISKNVSPKFRPFILNFLNFENEKQQHAYNCIHNKNILLIDDINTSGTTIRACLNAIYSIAEPKQIVILTVLGKELSDIT